MSDNSIAKHTPGPWRWDEPVWDYDREQQAPWLVAGAGDSHRVLSGEIKAFNEADAHLIAAAPDLLAALRDLDECYCEAGPHLTRDDRHRHRMVLIKARAAIAKATGGAA